eukprot:5944696-Prymnesium_polylepis.1
MTTTTTRLRGEEARASARSARPRCGRRRGWTRTTARRRSRSPRGRAGCASCGRRRRRLASEAT